MKKFTTFVSISILALGLAACEPKAEHSTAETLATLTNPAVDITIPYEKFTLSNGLRVIVHTDKKAPIVNVNVWYHVGSKNELEGKTGFAHLFEHLMFNGSENYDGEYFKPFEAIGVSGINGTTNSDRTNYYETVPTPALEMALWMESDRMGHLLGAITQEKLDEQRGVVQNEKRQGDNRPYGLVRYAKLEGLYPEGYPYRHSTIGSMEDLDAASLEDVHSWFKQYYGAANTVVVISGDVAAGEARTLVEKYFGDIPSGPALQKMQGWNVTLEHSKFEVMQSDVPQTRLYRTWSVPSAKHHDFHMLDVVTTIFGSGKNSRLYKALVVDKKLATSVASYVSSAELSSTVDIMATMAKGVDPAALSTAIDEVVAEFLSQGPTADELTRAQTADLMYRVNGLERVANKGQTLAHGEIYFGDPGFNKKASDWIMASTTGDVKDAAVEWLSKGFYQLKVEPFAKHEVTESAADRSQLPVVDGLPELVFPTLQEATLDNGIKVILTERHSVPKVTINMQLDAGYAADQGRSPGVAMFSMGMMDEGTKTRTASEIASELEGLGSSLSTRANLDMSTISTTTLSSNLDKTLEIYGDVVRNPSFTNEDIDRLRDARLAAIEQSKARPTSEAINILRVALYGDDHAYAAPNGGQGTTESVKVMTREVMVSYYNDWIRSDNATLFVAGDTTLEVMVPALNKVFGDWQAPASAMPVKNAGDSRGVKASKVILVDKPGAPQSMILAGHLVASSGDKGSLVFDAANDVFGGQFTARLNMNLREDKGWSYGAQTFTQSSRDDRPWMIYAPVQTDKTKESLGEIVREISEFLSTNPVKANELDAIIKSQTRSLPGRFETAGAVLNSMVENNRFGRRLDYATTLKAQYDALSLEAVNAEAKAQIKPDQIVWVIVGDVAKIEEGVRSLGLGDVEVRK